MEDEELQPKITKKINLLLMELNETSPITPETFRPEHIAATKFCRKNKIIMKGDAFKDTMHRCLEKIHQTSEENPSLGLK